MAARAAAVPAVVVVVVGDRLKWKFAPHGVFVTRSVWKYIFSLPWLHSTHDQNKISLLDVIVTIFAVHKSIESNVQVHKDEKISIEIFSVYSKFDCANGFHRKALACWLDGNFERISCRKSFFTHEPRWNLFKIQNNIWCSSPETSSQFSHSERKKRWRLHVKISISLQRTYTTHSRYDDMCASYLSWCAEKGKSVCAAAANSKSKCQIFELTTINFLFVKTLMKY